MTATKYEAASANVTVRAKGRKNSPMMPPISPSGKKTATVVAVEARIAVFTSPVPTITASFKSSPRWMWR